MIDNSGICPNPKGQGIEPQTIDKKLDSFTNADLEHGVLVSDGQIRHMIGPQQDPEVVTNSTSPVEQLVSTHA